MTTNSICHIRGSSNKLCDKSNISDTTRHKCFRFLQKMANLYCALILKLIYWQNDVIRNNGIFHDISRCSMATIFLWGFNVFILIFIIVLLLIQRNQFYFCEYKRRLSRISRITFYVKFAIHTWLVQSTSSTGILYPISVIRTLIVFKKQMNRLSKGKNAHIRTYL